MPSRRRRKSHLLETTHELFQRQFALSFFVMENHALAVAIIHRIDFRYDEPFPENVAVNFADFGLSAFFTPADVDERFSRRLNY